MLCIGDIKLVAWLIMLDDLYLEDLFSDHLICFNSSRKYNSSIPNIHSKFLSLFSTPTQMVLLQSKQGLKLDIVVKFIFSLN
jgi:hypothetical protein